MAVGTPMSFVKPQWFDSNGDPAAGYQLFVYESGGSTKATTWTSSTLAVANTNPIILDSAGRASIFTAGTETLKFVLATPTDTDPPTSPVWTMDGIQSVPGQNISLDVTGTAGENLTAGNCVYLSDGQGGRTAGRWYKSDSDLSYASVEPMSFGFAVADIASAASGSIRLYGRVTGLSGLTAGNVYYISDTPGAIQATAPINARTLGTADTTTSLILSAWPATALATVLWQGLVSTQAQVFGGEKSFAQPPAYYAGTTAASTGKTFITGVFDSQFSTAGVGNVLAVETTLFTTTIPGSLLVGRTPPMALRFTFRLAFAANANVKVVKIYFGATSISIVNYAINLANIKGMFEGILRRVSSTAQMLSAFGVVSTNAATGGLVFTQSGSPGETLSANIILKVTGTGVANDDILAYDWIVEVL